jgi:protein-S-isoprenylcysteine O-methyltransferase Ste14
LEYLVQRPLLAKVLYGFLFIGILPTALALWAHGTSNAVHLPALQSTIIGAVVIVAGLAIICAGMWSLWLRGGGLPMNAFPPTRFVQTGIYGVVPHPIYGGFVIACAGFAVLTGSASGLWLVTPSVALACAALVLGYERPDLQRRFGPSLFSPWLPTASSAPPTSLEHVRVYFVVLLPWLTGYEAVVMLGRPADAVTTTTIFENRFPVLQWTEAIYASIYLVVVLTPVMVHSGRALRQFAVRGLTAMAVVFPLYILLPFVAPPRPFVPTSPIGEFLQWERSVDSAAASFPSFHVLWALIAASALMDQRSRKRYGWAVWAALVSVSCVTTGVHSIADVVAGIIAYILVIKMHNIWIVVLRGAERIANSWKEWRIGPLRIINHGGYAAAAVLVWSWMIDAYLGPGHELLTLSLFFGATLGALLWAQWVEGSPSLLRPLGFYGGMLGALAGASVAIATGVNLWVTLAAICIATPWLQGLGRLRCLVQGCCHGRPTVTVPGIRYTHVRSRVCRLTTFGRIPVHATPVYSVLWNMLVGAILLRLAQFHPASTLIAGIYLFVSGIGRFVEEAYRGEPQTAVFWGLRFYQWVAVVTMIVGAAVTTVKGAPPLPEPTLRFHSFLVAAGCGLAAWIVTGVDFPESSRRFARLA